MTKRNLVLLLLKTLLLVNLNLVFSYNYSTTFIIESAKIVPMMNLRANVKDGPVTNLKVEKQLLNKKILQTFNYNYNKSCSFVIVSDNGVNCSLAANQQNMSQDCRYLAKLTVDKSFVDYVEFNTVEFCWGVARGYKFDDRDVLVDAWSLKNGKLANNIGTIHDRNYWFALHNISDTKYIMVPAHDLRTTFAVQSQKTGSIMRILNISPWYMPTLMKLPGETAITDPFHIKYEEGRFPIQIYDVRGRQLIYQEPAEEYNCTRVYTGQWTFCLEVYTEKSFPFAAAYPRAYLFSDAQTDEFEVLYFREKEAPSSPGLFDKIINKTIDQITETLNFTNKFNFTSDFFEHYILIPVENYLLNLIGRVINFILHSLFSWFEKVRLEYLELFISLDCKYMVVEYLVLLLIFYIYFPAYILTAGFALFLAILLGFERTYISDSPLEYIIHIINYIGNNTYLMECDANGCTPLYILKCANKTS